MGNGLGAFVGTPDVGEAVGLGVVGFEVGCGGGDGADVEFVGWATTDDSRVIAANE